MPIPGLPYIPYLPSGKAQLGIFNYTLKGTLYISYMLYR